MNRLPRTRQAELRAWLHRSIPTTITEKGLTQREAASLATNDLGFPVTVSNIVNIQREHRAHKWPRAVGSRAPGARKSKPLIPPDELFIPTFITKTAQPQPTLLTAIASIANHLSTINSTLSAIASELGIPTK